MPAIAESGIGNTGAFHILATGQSPAGNASSIYILGSGATDSGTLKAQGGSNAAVGVGGFGGQVSIASTSGASSLSVAKPGGIVVSGGTGNGGATTAASGSITVDGRLVTEQYTH